MQTQAHSRLLALALPLLLPLQTGHTTMWLN
jgi:hypothetical protein